MNHIFHHAILFLDSLRQHTFGEHKSSEVRQNLETQKVNDKTFYVCKCGLWYKDPNQAYACENYCKGSSLTFSIITEFAVASTYRQPPTPTPLTATEVIQMVKIQGLGKQWYAVTVHATLLVIALDRPSDDSKFNLYSLNQSRSLPASIAQDGEAFSTLSPSSSVVILGYLCSCVLIRLSA